MNDARSDSAERPELPEGPRTVISRFTMPADDWARDDAERGPRTVDALMLTLLAALAVAAGVAVAWYRGAAGAGTALAAILAALVVAAVLVCVAMHRVRRDLHAPLSELYAWALGMCTGDFSTRVPRDGEGAYRKLAFHVNRLSEALEGLANDMDDVVWRQTERLREKNASLELLYQVTASIHRLDSVDDILRTSARSMMKMAGARGAMLHLRDATGEVSGVTRVGEISGMTRVGEVSGVTRVGEVSGVTRVGEVSGVTRVGEVSGVTRVGEVSGVTRVGEVSGVTRVGEVSGVTRVGECPERFEPVEDESGETLPPVGDAPATPDEPDIRVSPPASDGAVVVTVPLVHKGVNLGDIRLFTGSPDLVESQERHRLLLSVGRHLGMSIAKARTDDESKMLSIVRERAAIAYELHDSLAQTLASLRLQADMLADSLTGRGGAGVPVELARIRAAVDSANIELRELIAGFRAPVDGRDLRAALEEMTARHTTGSGLTVRLQIEGELPELPAGPQLQVVRIVGEALANACAHSGGNFARVLVRSEATSVRVLVEDDGAGFSMPPSDAAPGEHIGLSVMHERARWLGGSLDIESEPGEGTRVSLAFPTPRAATPVPPHAH